MNAAQYVFGYGSLLQLAGTEGAPVHRCRLEGYRRCWDVAMENRRELPGYKHYLSEDGERPDIFVVFLNIRRTSEHRVNGVLLEVGAREMAELDSRERNYTRVDVTECIESPVAGTVWAYVGKREAVARFEHGMRERRAVVDQHYFDDVRKGFGALGDEALHEYEALTEPTPCPILALRRVDDQRASR